MSKKRRLFSERNLALFLVAGIVVGVVLGLIAQPAADDAPIRRFLEYFSLFGRLFLRALQMVVVPLILFSVVSGIANLAGAGEVGRKLGKVLLFFAATSLFAVLIGIFYTNVLQPGGGVDSAELLANLPETEMQSAAERQQQVELTAPATWGEFATTQIDNLFANPFASLANANLIGVVFFALFLGFMILLAGEKGRPAAAFFSSMNEVMMSMVQIVIWLAPLGVAALTANLMSAMGADVVRPLAGYMVTATLALLTQLLVVYPLILWLMCGYSPLKFFAGIRDAMLMALTTASSAATLPVTLRCVEHNLGVDNRSANFVLPMGATINMDGTALYEAVAAIFIAQMLGMDLGFSQQFIIFFTATLAAIGTAGIPQAGLVTMVIVFTAVGIPLEWMALIIVVDRPIDHLRTMVNVTGDATGSVFLSASEGELTRS